MDLYRFLFGFGLGLLPLPSGSWLALRLPAAVKSNRPGATPADRHGE
jgi:hypothetical protein